MNIYQVHADGLRALQSEQGDDCPVFTPLWASLGDIKILPGGVRTKRDNSPGGFSLDSDLQLTCLSVDLGVANADDAKNLSRKQFKYLDGRFSITSATLMPNGFQLRLNADNAAQKL